MLSKFCLDFHFKLLHAINSLDLRIFMCESVNEFVLKSGIEDDQKCNILMIVKSITIYHRYSSSLRVGTSYI